MEYKDQSAFPILSKPSNHGGDLYNYESGLTKREYFAGLAMQGILASGEQIEYGDYGKTRPMTAEEVAQYSLFCADALLTHLSNK